MIPNKPSRKEEWKADNQTHRYLARRARFHHSPVKHGSALYREELNRTTQGLQQARAFTRQLQADVNAEEAILRNLERTLPHLRELLTAQQAHQAELERQWNLKFGTPTRVKREIKIRNLRDRIAEMEKELRRNA